MSSLPFNPYIAGRPVIGDETFHGRARELALVERELRNPHQNLIILHGPRRIGKTSLLRRLERTLPSDAFLPIYFDLQDLAAAPLSEVLTDLAEAAVNAAAGDAPEASSPLLPATSGIDAKGALFKKKFLPALEKAIAPRRPVFLLDEFEVLDPGDTPTTSDHASGSLFKYLKRLLDEPGHTAFVFALGRRAEDLSQAIHGFFKAAFSISVWVLSEEEALILLRMGERQGGLSFSASAISHLLGLTARHPYLTQLVCQRLWELAVVKGAKLPVTPSLEQVDQAAAEALEAGSTALAWWWDGLGIWDQIFASAFAERAQQNTPLSEYEVLTALRRHSRRLQGARLEAAPEDLIKARVLKPAEGGGFLYEVELFRRWIQQHRPLRRTRLRLDEAVPDATRQFQQGILLLEQGLLGQSIECFRQAIRLHPGHLQARLRMAQAFFEENQLLKATEILEEAWVLEPDIAGARYQEALTELALSHARGGFLPDARAVVEKFKAQFPSSEASRCLEEKLIEAIRSLESKATPVPPGTSIPAASAEGPRQRCAPPHVSALAHRLFCTQETPWGNHRLLDTGLELMPGLLYHFRLERPDHKEASLQLFLDLKNLGGRLWEQQARALIQLTLSAHPALPVILDGGYVEEENLAFVITATTRYSLADEGALEHVRSHPYEATRQLLLLAEALATLHGSGMLHRNLTPEAIQLVTEPGKPPGLRLARFEMSVLLSNLLRRLTRQEKPLQLEVARGFYLLQGPLGLLCQPPERLELLLPLQSSAQGPMPPSRTNPSRNTLDTPASDVFSLGVLAYLCLVGNPPLEGLNRAFQYERWNRDAWNEVLKDMRATLSRAPLPKSLIEVLKCMLEDRIPNRLSANQVIKRLRQSWKELEEFWSRSNPNRPLLVATVLEEYGRELRARSYLDYDPATLQGVEGILEFMRDDLRGAELTYAERGFSPFTLRPHPEAHKARFVLLGRQFAYFCTIYEDRPLGNRPVVPMPQVLFSRFTLERHRFHYVDQDQKRLSLPALEPIPCHSIQLRPETVQRRAVWTPFLEAIEPELKRSPWFFQLNDGLSWLLHAHRVQLEAHMYAFDCPEPKSGLLLFDEQRDLKRRHTDALYTLYASTHRRQTMGDFFENQFLEENILELACCPDSNGLPRFDRNLMIRLRFIERLDRDRIRVKLEATQGGPIPRQGWIFPRMDSLSRLVLQRQERALSELDHLEPLVDQLDKPKAILRPFYGSDAPMRDLKGDAPEILRALLSSDPFFALHGPPGTGKTTVATRALEAILARDQASRILVSAQSNFALDNLAERLVARFRAREMDVIAVRVFSPHAGDRVSLEMKSLEPEALGKRRVRHITKVCEERIARREDPEAVLAILKRWTIQVERSRIEVTDRLVKGANLVFATCNAASPERVTQGNALESFDLVVVEEAAKAWPTELLIPLVRGRRWLLIGDHKQLPAFQKREVLELLRNCANSRDEQLRAIGVRASELEATFDLFKRLFEQVLERNNGYLFTDPRSRLRLQFRMAPAIGQLVSDAFYGGELQTDPSTHTSHGLLAPSPLSGHSLVWLDTHPLREVNEERPCWCNRLEVRIIASLLLCLNPPIDPQHALERLAVLAPYNDQVDALKRALQTELTEESSLEEAMPLRLLSGRKAPPRHPLEHLMDCVYTVDAFQGREAEIVIVSLTRYNQFDPTTRIKRRLGHLAEPERLNVMLSRAKRLLILVGDFAFFKEGAEALAQQGVPHWERICRGVETYGQLFGAQEVVRLKPEGDTAAQKRGH